MPAVLTTASTLTCLHGARIVVPPGQSRLLVGGSPALLRSDLANATVAGCPNANAAAGQKPCLTVTALVAGASTLLTVGGTAVLLDTARGLTDGVPPAPTMWQVTSAGHMLLAVDR